MMMNVLFVAALQDLTLTPNLGKGEKLDETTFITNDSDVIGGLVPKNMAHMIGELELNAIKNANAVIYSKSMLPVGHLPENYLVQRLYEIGRFYLCLWLVKDNSVHDEIGFLFHTNGVSSNFLAVQNLAASGMRESIKFNREELRKARRYYRDAVFPFPHKGERPQTWLTKEATRIDRAIYLVQAARSQSDIALRLVMLCTVFETIFSTSQNELSHQLSERVAYFLEPNSPTKRLEIYGWVKKMYALRSSFVHGSPIKETKIESLEEASKTGDALMRRCLSEILTNSETLGLFNSKPELLNKFFLNIVLQA